MIVLIAHHYDCEAIWLYESILKTGKKNIVLLHPEALGIDYSISLNIKKKGHTASIYFYESQQCIQQSEVTLLINRLSHVDPIVWKASNEKEKLYASCELNAFFSAFIFSFKCPTINPIKHGALYGNQDDYRLLFTKQTTPHINMSIREFNSKSYEYLQQNLTNCKRCILLNGKFFAIDGQEHEHLFDILKHKASQLPLGSMWEFYFLQKGNGFELIYASKMTALSLYQNTLTKYILSLSKTKQYDTHIRNSKRIASEIIN